MFTPDWRPCRPHLRDSLKERQSQRSRKSILCWNEHQCRRDKLELLLAESPPVAHETTGSVDLLQISSLGYGRAPAQSEHVPQLHRGGIWTRIKPADGGPIKVCQDRMCSRHRRLPSAQLQAGR
jgi:hypothetical protein